MTDFSDQPGSRAYDKWASEHDFSSNRILPSWSELLQTERDQWNAVAYEYGREVVPASWRPLDTRGPPHSVVFGLDDAGKRVLHPSIATDDQLDPVKQYEQYALQQSKLPVDITIGDQVFKTGTPLFDLVTWAKSLYQQGIALPPPDTSTLNDVEVTYTASGRIAQPGNPDWCIGCSPDNCSGCGPAP